jgi:hypothetical protein
MNRTKQLRRRIRYRDVGEERLPCQRGALALLSAGRRLDHREFARQRLISATQQRTAVRARFRGQHVLVGARHRTYFRPGSHSV